MTLNLPKALSPKTKATKQKKHQNKKGGLWRGRTSIRENGVETKTPKKTQKFPQPQGHVSQRPRFGLKIWHTRASKIFQICACPENVKNAIFQNDLGSAAPSAFLASKHNFV